MTTVEQALAEQDQQRENWPGGTVADGVPAFNAANVEHVERSNAESTTTPVAKPRRPRKPRKPNPNSRSARWAAAASAAIAGLEALVEIQDEYEEWQSNLPENLQGSALGEKLDTVCEIDLDSALEAAQEADGADLPLGFGRD